ncbi:sugar transferase [Curtobacterium flaccumfaciens]|nr:sugar transferase [Curtobacterium flaccumfaciens]
MLAHARAEGVSAVVVAGAVRGGHARLRRLGWQLEEHGVELVVSSPLADIAAGRVHERPVDGLPLMHVETPDYRRRMGKRALDVVGAVLGLALLSPVLAAVALAVRADDGGPVFFRQVRVGRGGAEFPILKFRTMCVDAEARMAALQSENQGAGPLFKMQDDPRVTRVGAFPATDLARRTAAAVERAHRVDEPGRPPTGPAPRGRAVRGLRRPPTPRDPGDHRPVAGQRPIGPRLGRRGAARPALRRELVVPARPGDPRPHRPVGAAVPAARTERCASLDERCPFRGPAWASRGGELRWRHTDFRRVGRRRSPDGDQFHNKES